MRFKLIITILLIGLHIHADTLSYDDLGRLIQRVNNDGNGLALSYDKAGNLLTAASITIAKENMGLQVETGNNLSVSLRWNQAAEASEYRVYRKTAESSTWEFLSRLSADTVLFMDTVPAAGVTYVYRIATIGPEGVIAFSNDSLPAEVAGSNFSFQGDLQAGEILNYEIQFAAEASLSYRFEYTSTLQVGEWSLQPYISIVGDTPHTNLIINQNGPVKLKFSLEPSELPRFFRLVEIPVSE